MGTRNLTMVLLNGEIRVAQYGQWDGNPSGQGKTIAEFLSFYGSPFMVESFKKQVAALKFISHEEVQTLRASLGKDVLPAFTRDTAAEILDHIAHRRVERLEDNSEFAADSLMCEWAYVVDLDTAHVEIYKGFNKEPLTHADRFFYLESKAEGGYHPVKLWKRLPFKEFTSENLDELEKIYSQECAVEDERTAQA